jgi:hypothetical protein
MTPHNSRFAAWLGTAAVVVHGIPLVLHGMAHAQLAIYLPSVLANIYIGVVLYLAPVVAACPSLGRPHSPRGLVAHRIDAGIADLRGV